MVGEYLAGGVGSQKSGGWGPTISWRLVTAGAVLIERYQAAAPSRRRLNGHNHAEEAIFTSIEILENKRE